jgi:hypothetical protein
LGIYFGAMLGQAAHAHAFATGQYHPKFVQQAAQRIHAGRAHRHPVRAHAVQRQLGLLLATLDRYAAQIRMLGGQPYRAGVHRIVLVASHEGAHLVGGQQLDLVAQRSQGTSPMVGSAARFHHYPPWQALRKELGQLGARELLAVDLTGVGIYPMHLKHILGDIHAVSRNIHVGPPSSVVEQEPPLWHFDAVDARPHPLLGRARWEASIPSRCAPEGRCAQTSCHKSEDEARKRAGRKTGQRRRHVFMRATAHPPTPLQVMFLPACTSPHLSRQAVSGGGPHWVAAVRLGLGPGALARFVI